MTFQCERCYGHGAMWQRGEEPPQNTITFGPCDIAPGRQVTVTRVLCPRCKGSGDVKQHVEVYDDKVHVRVN